MSMILSKYLQPSCNVDFTLAKMVRFLSFSSNGQGWMLLWSPGRMQRQYSSNSLKLRHGDKPVPKGRGCHDSTLGPTQGGLARKTKQQDQEEELQDIRPPMGLYSL
jgi:hypothetical protein